MKKILFMAVVLVASTSILCAQDNDTIPRTQDKERIFKEFKGDAGVGYALFPGNAEIKHGLIFAIEPKYLVLDQLAIGFRYELDVLFKEVKTLDFYGNYAKDRKVKVYESFGLTSEFYFTNNYKCRPFIGAGAGVFLVSSTTPHQYNSIDDDSDVTKAKFGGFARGGIEIKHFRVALEYNFVPKTRETEIYYDSQGNYHYQSYKFKNAYIGIKLGFSFWHWSDIV